MLRYRAQNPKNKFSAVHSTRTSVSRPGSASNPRQSALKRSGGAPSHAASAGKPASSVAPIKRIAVTVLLLIVRPSFTRSDVPINPRKLFAHEPLAPPERRQNRVLASILARFHVWQAALEATVPEAH